MAVCRHAIEFVPTLRTYPFKGLLPYQVLEVDRLGKEGNARTEGAFVRVAYMMPSLVEVREDSTSGGPRRVEGCFCGRPHLGGVRRYRAVSAECDQRRALEVTRGSGGSGALFCDYVCLGRYLLSVYEACPFRGDRLVHLCAAMVEAVAFLIRDMRYACGDSYGVPLGAYDDDGSLVALLNGEWPLCTVAIRGIIRGYLAVHAKSGRIGCSTSG